jgi:hypothetical protein
LPRTDPDLPWLDKSLKTHSSQITHVMTELPAGWRPGLPRSTAKGNELHPVIDYL